MDISYQLLEAISKNRNDKVVGVYEIASNHPVLKKVLCFPESSNGVNK
jgi:hypothetical protein